MTKGILNLRGFIMLCLLVFGLVLMAAGIVGGENADIMEKGALICMECIGIG
jgi:hypothetical protein